MTNTSRFLENLMLESYTVENLPEDEREAFERSILSKIGTVDSQIEGYRDEKRQRDLSVKFHWGHNHDFGAFKLIGRMGDRHIAILSNFIDRFGLPRNLRDKNVLDVGVWTGGTSLILSKLGANVTAIEEVKKYADTVEFLAEAFSLNNIKVRRMSLYAIDDADEYDFIIFAGVLYHVTDPILALRILFNALKDGGRIFVETMAANASNTPPFALVEGPQVTRGGSKEDLSRGGWNYFVPSDKALALWLGTVGFEDIDIGAIVPNNHLMAVATRNRHVDMLRAGLSRPDIR